MLTQSTDSFGGERATIDSKDIAILCARIADNKKGEDIIIFEVQRLTSVTDYFVICSGLNKKQLQSMATDIRSKLQNYNIREIGVEGYVDAQWILMDYGDVIIHLFNKDMRRFYDLELLWGDAPKLSWNSSY